MILENHPSSVANMETLEVHAKDFLVKWVNAPEECVIKWQVKSLKKSINLAIYCQDPEPTAENANPSKSETQALYSSSQQSSKSELFDPNARVRSNSVTSVNQIKGANGYRTKSRSSTFSSMLNTSQLKIVKNYYKIIPDELVRGTFEVVKPGTYAFVFDNSFSKTIGKKVYFSAKAIPKLKATQMNSNSSSKVFLPSSMPDVTSENILRPKNGELMQGVLLKKRRKKLQGFTKRFFILNFKYGVLSYFKNSDNKLRGQMPITNSIVSVNTDLRDIFIDSGMEVWHLRTLNRKDFEAWIAAFDGIKKAQHTKAEAHAPIAGHESLGDGLQHWRCLHQNLESLLQDFPVTSKSEIESRLRDIHSQLTKNLNESLQSDVTSITSEADFFDAFEDLKFQESGVLFIEDDQATKSNRSDNEFVDEVNLADNSSSEYDTDFDADSPPLVSRKSDSPSRSDLQSDLYPLPLLPIERESDIPECHHEPPSILSHIRKNVGKDLSSMSMPVDMNEPLSFLQRFAEMMEYSEIIDHALQASYPVESGEFILRVAAFSVTYLSAMRMKVRALRKPFNPLLGESYELIREDKGFRLISEKVSHKPPVFAMDVQAFDWSLSFSPAPSQKYWGKTCEILTQGTVKLTIKNTGEVYTWSIPTCILRNIIAGEKYTEPSSTVTIKCSNGQRAVIEFSKGGMFSGRSEGVTIRAFDHNKRPLPYHVYGKWTESLTLKTNTTEKEIWNVGELLPRAEKKFGLTRFAGELSKMTSIEKDQIPVVDSRHRPDMQAYLLGNVEEAEKLKQQLEEGQRNRRKELEISGLQHTPSFFKKVGGTPDDPLTGDWVLDLSENGYWNRRKRRDWSGVQPLW